MSRTNAKRLAVLGAEKVKFCPGCGHDLLSFDALALGPAVVLPGPQRVDEAHRGGSARGPPRDIAPGLAEGSSAGGSPEVRSSHRLRPEKSQTVALRRGFESRHLHDPVVPK